MFAAGEIQEGCVTFTNNCWCCVMAVNDEKHDPEQPWGYINYNSLIQHTTAKKWKTMVFCHCSCSFMYHVHLFLPPSPSVLNCITQHTQVKASAISTVPVENICTVLYVVCGLHLVTTCCSCSWLAAYICSHFLFYCAVHIFIHVTFFWHHMECSDLQSFKCKPWPTGELEQRKPTCFISDHTNMHAYAVQ